MKNFNFQAASKLVTAIINKVVSPDSTEKSKPKSYPQPPCSSALEINTYNEGVKTRQVTRSKARLQSKLER